MRLDEITNSMDMSLSKQTLGDNEGQGSLQSLRWQSECDLATERQVVRLSYLSKTQNLARSLDALPGVDAGNSYCKAVNVICD